jgi:hypothetical protein
MRYPVSLVLALLSCMSCKSSPDAPDGGSSAPPSPVPSASTPPQPRGVSGQIIRLQADQVLATEPVPPSPLGHGEALRAIWTAGDGTTFAAGYRYVGTRGHDTGAVYRRVPGGAFELVYSKAETELGRLWGRSASDVYAGGVQTLAHFDGKGWSEIAIPHLEGSISGIWGDAVDLWVSAGHQFNAFIHHRDGAGAWSVEAKTDVMLFNLGGVGSSVWAVGSSGTVFHREKDGHWKRETEARSKEYTTVWASAEDDVYTAGTGLLHSRGDGAWVPVELPVGGPLRYVWGRGKDDVFVGVAGGLFHLAGGTWTKTGFAMDSAGISGAGKDLFVAHNDIH